MEIWKDIKGYEGKYQISNNGKVKNIKKNKYIKHFIDDFGYVEVFLFKNNKNQTKKIHRLLAEAFIENPYKLPIINHIDGNKKNNKLENLEWCTYKENAIHAWKNNLCKKIIENHHKCPIIQKDKNNKVLNVFGSEKEAETITKISRKAINNCLKKRSLTAGNYIWEYK